MISAKEAREMALPESILNEKVRKELIKVEQAIYLAAKAGEHDLKLEPHTMDEGVYEKVRDTLVKEGYNINFRSAFLAEVSWIK